MNEPDPKPPLADDSVQGFFKRLLVKNEWLIDKIIKGLLLLAAGYISVKVANVEKKTSTIEVKQDSIEQKAEVAATKADAAADVGKVNLALNTAQRVDDTGKKPSDVLAEAQRSAEQLPTTGPAGK